MRIGRQCLAVTLLLALAASGAEDQAALLKRAAQFEQGLQARAAALLATDAAIQDANSRLKLRQQLLADALAAQPEVAALAPLKTANPMAYRRQYVPLRARLLREDRQLRERHADVLRLTGELARRLAADPASRELRERLAAVSAQLVPAPRP